MDFIADGVDQMNDTLKFPSAPFSMGYYVEPLYTEGVAFHGVKNDNAPYQLYRYDDQWFADSPYTDNADKGKLFQVYDKSREVAKKTASNPTDFPFVQSAILTNTKGTNGRVANVDKDQFWKTDAKDDGPWTRSSTPTTPASPRQPTTPRPASKTANTRSTSR